VLSAEPLHRALGLTDDELGAIVELLGRDPSELELAMYAVMWSEHCSYKSSKVHLRRLEADAPWVLVGPGEGAGVIDVGDGLAVAVRIESHNHPSAVEPYQGAATGVGGIIRDVFSMGARPVALMDPLRFGPLDDARSRYLCEQVVAGISGYGNAVGVPTVGGELGVAPCYAGNPLVNVLCLGVAPQERLVLARAGAAGNLAVLLGSSTGRDGIGGASVLASAGFAEGSEEKRPSVQVGDPFEEKRLIEACLALLDAGLAVGIQDLGAGGLSCAASETAAKSGLGMDVDIARVARREPHMTPVEVMTSESQERMLAIVEPVHLDALLAICDRWEVRATVVGEVTEGGRFRVVDGAFDGDAREALADVPAASLGDGPVYTRPAARPASQDELNAADPWPVLARCFPDGADLEPELLALLASPTLADKSWVWGQYDHQLFLNTVVGPGADATVLRLRGTSRALALSTDGSAAFCRLDPRVGGRLAVLETARNVACVGAVPRAVVNCLNFGNPEHPAVMWQFAEVVDGIQDACGALGVPVIGGNVSFYNESHGHDIDPTPVIGLVGLLDALERIPPPPALGPDQTIVLLGSTRAELGGSAWAAHHDLTGGRPPAADLDTAVAVHECARRLVADDAVRAVHDCAEGGLAAALAEMAIVGECGARVALPAEPPVAASCFAESASRVLVTVGDDAVGRVLARAASDGVAAAELGRTGGSRLQIDGALDVDLADAGRAWHDGLPATLERR
jgi:phosphoribosylformylglycinamidine synthase subunit PurL